MSTAVSICEYDPASFDRLVELFASYFPAGDKLLSRDYTEWLYLKNPSGPAKLAIVEEDGKWVAFMAMIPVDLFANDAKLLGYFVVNVLVHADFQGKFLFGKMITEAKKFVEVNSAVLLGHPNGLAVKTWHRAKMKFFPELRPYLFIPGWKGAGYSVSRINRADELEGVFPVGSPYPDGSGCVRQLIDSQYIQWRFLIHPVNTYRVQLLRHNGLPCGLMVSRTIKFKLGLLIDLFAMPEHVNAAVRALPAGTVAFMPENSASLVTRSAWALPLKKRMPFFFGSAGGAAASIDTVNINLSASDF